MVSGAAARHGQSRPSTSPASRCRARPRSPPGPTARWPGDSPTATAISPTRAGASARAPTIGVRREHIAVKGARGRRSHLSRRRRRRGARRRGICRRRSRAANACRRRGSRRGPKRPTSGCSALESARSIDDVLAIAPQRRHSRAEHGRRRYARTHRLDLVRPRARAPRARPAVRCARISATPSIIRASPIRPWGGCGPRISAWSRAQLEAVLGDDEVDVGAGGYDIGARARQIRDDLLSLVASGHRGRHARDPARFARAVRWRAGAICCSRSSTRTRWTTRRCAASFARWSATGSGGGQRRCRGLSAGAHISRQHAERACGAASSPGC